MKIIITESQLRTIIEGSEHTKKLYMSWAINKSGNVEGAKEIMNDVFELLKQKKIKDFSQYSSYDELKKDVDKFKEKIEEKKKREDVEEIYRGENGDDLVVVAPKTWESSCDYGSQSKWCTTSRKKDSDWKRYNEMGTEFFWIFRKKDKSDSESKYSYHINFNGSDEWCNALNQCFSQLSKYSSVKSHPKYDSIMEKIKKFHYGRKDIISIRNAEFAYKFLKDNFNLIMDEIEIMIDELMDKLLNQDKTIELFIDEDKIDDIDKIKNNFNRYVKQNIDSLIDEQELYKILYNIFVYLMNDYGFNQNELFSILFENENIYENIIKQLKYSENLKSSLKEKIFEKMTDYLDDIY